MEGKLSKSSFNPSLPLLELQTSTTEHGAGKDAIVDQCVCTSTKYCPLHSFRFMDLPTELRVNIYQKALVRHEPVNLAQKLPPSLRKPLPIGVAVSQSLYKNEEGKVYGENEFYNRTCPRPATEALTVELLRVCKQIYQEALPALYRENTFNLPLRFAITPLTGLRQHTRCLIKRAIITFAKEDDVNSDHFAKLMRTGLRYCFALSSLEIINKLPNAWTFKFDPDFQVMRWLPKGCRIEMKEQNVPDRIRKLVDEQNGLARELNLVGCSGSAPSARISTWSGAYVTSSLSARHTLDAAWDSSFDDEPEDTGSDAESDDGDDEE